MTTRKTSLFAGAMAALFMGGTILTPLAAQAQSEGGRRNTTLGLGALTGYLFTRKGSKVPAFIAAGATAYAYKRYQDAINARHKRERQARYYRAHHRSHHSSHHRHHRR